MLDITVNGEAQQVAEGTTVADLLRAAGLFGAVAVERNREIVPRARHTEVLLERGDQIEIVTFVGGG